jgi:single-stranded DNA-binding protein|nr:MAG TPA: Single strand binding protein [Caudoviricetes sp.]
MNNANLVGRLTRPVDLRYTQSGIAYGSFTLAVTRKYKNKDGEREADFINCVIWKKGAELLANYTQKGSLIGVSGPIQTRSYDNQQGQRVYVTEVLVENFDFLESRKNDADGFSNAGNINTQNFNKNQNLGGNFSNNDPFTANGETFEVQDDDLPF